MKKKTTKFDCPAIQESWNECEFFGKGTHYCPYGPLSVMAERAKLPDCPHAPEQIWKSFKNQKERGEILGALEKIEGGLK